MSTTLGVLTFLGRPANLAWGDDDRRTLYLTPRLSLYRIRVRVPELAPVWAKAT